MSLTKIPWLASLMLDKFSQLLNKLSKKYSVTTLDILSFSINKYFDPVSNTYFFMHNKIECKHFDECEKCSLYNWETLGHCNSHETLKDCKYCTYIEKVFKAQAELLFKHKRLIPDSCPFNCVTEVYDFSHQKQFSTLFDGDPLSITGDKSRAILVYCSPSDIIREYKIITCGPLCTTI